MRTRIIAIILLVFLVGGPLFGYWYFYKKNISSIIFLSDLDESYTVTLHGKLEYKYFPLLDEVFQYESTCQKSCIFSPVPPLHYEVKIQTQGREDILENIILHAGDSYKYQVKLSQALFFEKVASMPTATPSSQISGYLSVGVSSKGKIVAVENKQDGGNIGVINSGKFVTLFRTPTSLLGSYLDQSRLFLIAPMPGEAQSIYGLEGGDSAIKFPSLEKVIMVTKEKNQWKVKTQEHLYEYVDSQWKKNPRFTDYIDITPRYRLGYISSLQSKKLSLQNLPSDTSVIVLLDRLSTDMTIMKKGVDIVGFFFYDGIPVFLDGNGDLLRINLKGIQ